MILWIILTYAHQHKNLRTGYPAGGFCISYYVQFIPFYTAYVHNYRYLRINSSSPLGWYVKKRDVEVNVVIATPQTAAITSLDKVALSLFISFSSFFHREVKQ